MTLNMKENLFDLIFRKKEESIETRQIDVQHNKTTTQDFSFDDSAMLLTFRLSQFLGIQPIYIKKRTSKTYHISISPVVYVLNIIICVLTNGVVLYGSFATLIKGKHQVEKSTTYTRVDEKHKFIIVCVLFPVSAFLIICTLYGKIRVRRILDCLECIKKIKQSINKSSYQYVQNRRKICSIILFATFSPIFFRFTSVGFIRSFSGFYSYMCMIISVVVVLLVVQFFLLVEYLNSLFEAINKELKEILSHLNFYYIERRHSKNILLKIHHLMICFVDSCKMLKKINSNESLLLFCLVILCPLYITLCFYFILHALVLNVDTNTKLIAVCREAYNCFYNLFMLCFLVLPCHQTQKKIKETKHLVSNIMCHIQSENDPLFESVDAFYKQLLLNDYAFTAMDICDIGTPLITKIIGLSFSLVMVILF